MDERELIRDIVQEYKHFRKIVKVLADRDLLHKIPRNTDNLSQDIFDYLYPEKKKVCTQRGEVCKFTSFSVGYSFCGPSRTCACSMQSMVDKIAQKRDTYTDERKQLIKERREQTVSKKYGVSNVFMSEKVKEKIVETNLTKYGVENPRQSDSVIDRAKQTCLERYGVDNPAKNVDVQAKIRNTMLERYGAPSHTQQHFHEDLVKILDSPEILKDTLTNISGNYLAKMYGVSESVIYSRMEKYGLSHLKWMCKTSGPEYKLSCMIDEIGINYTKSDRTRIKPYELDFFFPDYNLAIEINGIYWHCTGSKAYRDKNYHFDKWKKCREVGITLLSFTDSDVLYRPDFIKAKLRYVTRKYNSVVGARKCAISKVSKSHEFEFLDKHHIQGRLISRQGALGAYYSGKLVAVINWVIRKSYIEITRYCCDGEHSYPGLFSRMMKAMVTETGYSGDIVSFSNNDHSNGNVYLQSGFSLDKILGPAYWYTKDFVTLENRQNYMKEKIKRRFGVCIEGKTEFQLMEELGYHRYYDTGKIRWKMVTRDI